MNLYDFVNMIQNEEEFPLEFSDCMILIKSRKGKFIESLEQFLSRFDKYRNIDIYQVEIFNVDNEGRYRLYDVYNIENQ